jgi:streptomycin 6-kinase
VRLPDAPRELERRWSLTVGAPFDVDEVSCAWVAPAKRRDGTSVVLKLGMPHMEGEQEIEALRFWAGEPSVLLLDADAGLNAMLLERCEPGTWLRTQPEPEQDRVMAQLMRRGGGPALGGRSPHRRPGQGAVGGGVFGFEGGPLDRADREALR